jgi:phosphohistidine phosphatase
MRHAKSSWKHHDLEDIQRPLNKRGKKDAPMMGKLMRDKELVPQKILSSTAERARETVEAFVEASGYEGDVSFLDSFYLAEPQVYINELHNLSDQIERVMVVGHNPGLEGVVQILSDQVESLPTAAIAYIVLPIQNWSELTGDSRGELVELWRPRDFREKSKK